MRFRLPFLPICLLIGCLYPIAGFAQSLDGVWTGSFTCSENFTNRNPGYTVSLELQISGTTGRAERADAQSQETFALQVQPSGAIELQSTGRLRNDTTPRWTTRLAGRASGADKLELRSSTLVGEKGVFWAAFWHRGLEKSIA